MSINWHDELITMRDDTVADRALIVRLAQSNSERLEVIDELLSRTGTTPEMPATCRHQMPIADWCAYCNETPEG